MTKPMSLPGFFLKYDERGEAYVKYAPAAEIAAWLASLGWEPITLKEATALMVDEDEPYYTREELHSIRRDALYEWDEMDDARKESYRRAARKTGFL